MRALRVEKLSRFGKERCLKRPKKTRNATKAKLWGCIDGKCHNETATPQNQFSGDISLTFVRI